MRISKTLLLSLLVPLAFERLGFVDAFHFPLVARSRSSALSRRSEQLVPGDGLLHSVNDTEYLLNITLGGAPFMVAIDTGSADLWVAATNVVGANDTGKNATLAYAVGQIAGPIKTATLGFLGFTIENQAFIQAIPPTGVNAPGIIGLGPGFTSFVFDILNSTTADMAVNRLFQQNSTISRYMTILLGRALDPDNVEGLGGELTIGEIIPGYENVQNQPKVSVPLAVRGSQHWSVQLDEDGIIGPDGKSIPLTTTVNSTKDKKVLTSTLDTGFTYSQVPGYISDAIYGNVNGAQFDNQSGLWVCPCEQEVNVTIKIGGQSYPMSPLDTTITVAGHPGACIGTFQHITTGADPATDMILGMPFLRNVYLLINHGSWASDNITKADAYIQLLSTTDSSDAHGDFVRARLNGTDDTSNSSDTASENSGKSGLSNAAIIGIVIGTISLLTIGGLFAIYRKRQSPVDGESYRTLENPAPMAAEDTQMIHLSEPYRDPYTD